MVSTLITFAAEASHEGTATPYIVGLSTFLFLLALLAGVLAIGGGRDHS